MSRLKRWAHERAQPWLWRHAATWRTDLAQLLNTHYRLFVATIAVLAVAAAIKDRAGYLQDEFIAATIAITMWCAVGIMLAATTRWTWRATGILFVFLGDAQLYTWTWLRLHGSETPITSWRLALLRASLAVGGVLFFLGIVKWGLDRWVLHRPATMATFLDWLDSREGFLQ